ncbi:penicillin-binding protein [Patescibacteria group bacterium]|nr:MAG: penicillin-binding protein [Patescibacteria group bacterium]
MAKRRVIRSSDRSFAGRAKRFGASFLTPSNFKRYWLNAEGAKRAGKIAGAGFLAMFLVLAYFAKDLPSPGKINARIGSQNTVFYDRTGQTKIFEVHGDKNRKVIEFQEMPQSIKDATVAIEDKDFYKHGAFSFMGVGRAFTGILFRDPTRGGGSTITQQYVKNALLTPERSYTRKIKELILAFEIEQLYKKDDILKLYLNEIPYGSQAYGVESACRTYFPQNIQGDKCAKNLTLAQSATLASIPQLPTYYSPYGQNRDALIARQHTVLDRMVEQKKISQQEADAAKIQGGPSLDNLVAKLNLSPVPKIATQKTDFPHFARYAQEYLEAKYGVRQVEDGGLKVITSLDIEKQKQAEEAIKKNMTNVRRLGGSNAALVSADPKTGQVLAMVGSYDYNDPDYGDFNVALAKRQPGSSFKPIVYATGFKKNWGPGSTIYDVQTDFGNYKPKNYTGKFYGVQSVRTALAGSLNIPAVKMLWLAGIPESLKTAKDLGITTLNESPSTYGLSLVLGSGEVKLNEMVNAYESFANGGTHYDATPILKVTDPNNKVVEDNEKPKGKKALDPQIPYLISSILSDNKARSYIFGANNPLVIPGRTVAAKTGTTENYNDAWTMGYTPDLVTGVWAGNNNNKPMTSSASTVSAPIWNTYMKSALQGYPNKEFTKPSGIKEVTLDANTGKLPTASTKQRRTDIFPSWYRPENVAGTQTGQVDKVSGKLATECTPPEAVETVTTAQISAEVPPSDPQYSKWFPPIAALARTLGYTSGGAIPVDKDDVHKCTDIKPTAQISATGTGPIQISVNVVQGTHPLKSLTVYLNDQIISTQEISGSTTYNFTNSPPAGSYTLRAVVTDAALYSGSSETTVTVASGGSAGGASFCGNQPCQPGQTP